MEWYLTHEICPGNNQSLQQQQQQLLASCKKKKNLLFAFLAAYCASLSFVTSSSCEIKEKTWVYSLFYIWKI